MKRLFRNCNILKQRTLKAFSLLEIMVALVIVSIMLAVMAPTLTVKAPQKETVTVQASGDNIPVGAIIAWYGTKYPEGWLPLDGQVIDAPEYEELRGVLEGLSELPDVNHSLGVSSPIVWIIKAR